MSVYMRKISNTRIIALSFLLIIFTGTLLLMLPVSSAKGVWTPFINALFTATSATCVTGLVVYDTGKYWSLFGQIVIITMIQVGGLGLLTIISLVPIILKRKIGLSERELLMQSAGKQELSGVVKLVKRIIKITFVFELAGSVLLATRFIPAFGLKKGIYYSIFHSISAFCNAGFDLMGNFASLTGYESDVVINVTIMLLIVFGGLGFLVWEEIYRNRFHFNKYSLHAKIVLVTTLVLILGGAAGFLFFERNGDLAGRPVYVKLLDAFFMSVTTRTAGFNTIDLAKLSHPGSILAMVLMFIGGSPGSTAGGIKTTTAAVIFIAVVCLSRGGEEVTAYNRRIDDAVVKHAAVIILVYLIGVLTAGMIISSVEPYETRQIFFEITSAAGTVGLTMGITPKLTAISKTVLILLMYSGRIGGFSFMMALREKQKNAVIRRPVENLMIG